MVGAWKDMWPDVVRTGDSQWVMPFAQSDVPTAFLLPTLCKTTIVWVIQNCHYKIGQQSTFYW